MYVFLLLCTCRANVHMYTSPETPLCSVGRTVHCILFSTLLLLYCGLIEKVDTPVLLVHSPFRKECSLDIPFFVICLITQFISCSHRSVKIVEHCGWNGGARRRWGLRCLSQLPKSILPSKKGGPLASASRRRRCKDGEREWKTLTFTYWTIKVRNFRPANSFT